MVRKVDQGTIVILDVGKNAAPKKDEKSFFDMAKDCTTRLFERKILSQSKSKVDYLGILLMGSQNTKNNMAEQFEDFFKNIELLADLQVPTWKMIRDLPGQTSNCRGDWFDALMVATDHFKSGVYGVNIVTKKILLMTNFKAGIDIPARDAENFIQGLKEEGIQVDVIGVDIYNEKESTEIEIIRKIVDGTDGATATFNDALQYLNFHKKKVTKPIPWNTDLTIGPNIKIPISSYIRLKDDPPVKNWIKAIKDPITSSVSKSEAFIKNPISINPSNQTEVEYKDTIKGIHYGDTVIPFSDTDKSMLYEPGEKSLCVYGFTEADNVTWQNLNGEGISYIFGRKGDNKAENTIKCLVRSLHKLKLVGIVRRVYNNGNGPQMFALLPVIDTNNFICLSMIGICYKEEIKHMAFPSTSYKKYDCTEKQVNGFKDLIHAMDLNNAYDDSFDDAEAFPIGETVCPNVQYKLDCIAHRAMNRGAPLIKPNENIMSLFKIPALVEKRSKDSLDTLKELFVLKKVEEKTKKQKNNDQKLSDDVKHIKCDVDGTNGDMSVDMPKIQLPIMKAEVTSIGTVDPVNDFNILSEKGIPISDLYDQLIKSIENIFFSNFDGKYSKALDTLKFFRTECVAADPTLYNIWLRKFRADLHSLSKQDILKVIKENKLGFISKHENDLSSYDVDNEDCDSQLYENDTVPNPTELTIQSEINDLFDEM